MAEISKQLLHSLNLTPDEAGVYVAAMELGQAHMQALARKSGVKRTTIYHFLPGLIERGLLQEVRKKKRTVYSAIHPKQLVELERVRMAELERLMPQLLAVYNRSQTKPRVTFYEGKEGIKEAFTDTLAVRNAVIYGFGDFENEIKVVGNDFYMDYYIPERRKRNIFYKGILRDSEEARRFQRNDNKELRETKLSPGTGVSTDLAMYNDKIIIISYRSATPFAVIIEDKNITDSWSYIWQLVWDLLPQSGAPAQPTTSNEEGSE